MTKEMKKLGKYEYEYESFMVWDLEHRKRHKGSRYLGKAINEKTRRIRGYSFYKGAYTRSEM